MYIFVDSVVLKRSIGSQWEHLDTSNIVVSDIFNAFIKTYLILNTDISTTDVYVDLDTLKAEFSSYSGTLNELLVALGTRVLVTTTTIPDTTIKHVRYSDAIRSEYKITPINKGVSTPTNFPKRDLKDIEITRPMYATSMALLHSHCLVSVNGYYHMTDTDGSRVYVDNANTTLQISNNNNVGITSFLDVGALTKVPIDINNIHGDVVSGRLIDKVIFTVPEPLDNKSYLLILGGYMVLVEDGVFWRSGNDSFTLDMNKIPYIERIYESNSSIDLSPLGLSSVSINPDAMAMSELRSDTVIAKYLTLSQSYLVVVDTPVLLSNKIHVRQSNLPGMFTAYQDPTFPLITAYGKLADYWKTYEDNQWSVTVTDSFLRNYIFTFQATHPDALITDNLLPMLPFEHSRAFLLDLQTY